MYYKGLQLCFPKRCSDLKKLPTDKIYTNPNFDIWGTSSICVNK